MNNLPLARSKELVVQELGNEVLIYDLNTHKAYHLNETSAIVYRACDGKTTFDQLRLTTKFTDEIIFLALDELKKENLIQANDSYASPFAGMTRREVIRKVGLASIVALPVISSLVAPEAAAAQSACNVGAACTCTGGVPNALPTPQECAAILAGTSNCNNVASCDCLVAPGGSTGTCGNI